MKERAAYYLCKRCWWMLPAATRTLLNLRDADAWERVGLLHRMLARKTPLAYILPADVTPLVESDVRQANERATK
jgi:hypothetical protein